MGLGFPLLDGIKLSEIMIMTIPGIPAGIEKGSHGHDGPAQHNLSLFLMVTRDVLVSPRTAALLGL